MPDRKKRIAISDKHRFNHSCKQVFELLCPVKEDEWLPGWREQKKMVYTESGFAELGCVFVTKTWPNLMGPAVWVNNVYMPFEKIRYTAISKHIVYQIECDLKSVSSGCEAVAGRTWTALSSEAEEFLIKMEREGQRRHPSLFELIDHYLKTKKMLSP